MKAYSDINLNFLAHPATGDLVKVKDDNSIKQSVKLLVLSGFYERAFRPEIGCSVGKLLFEPVTKYTSYLIASSIDRVLREYETRVVVNSVIVTPNEEEMTGYDVAIDFTILNTANKATIEFLLRKT